MNYMTANITSFLKIDNKISKIGRKRPTDKESYNKRANNPIAQERFGSSGGKYCVTGKQTKRVSGLGCGVDRKSYIKVHH